MRRVLIAWALSFGLAACGDDSATASGGGGGGGGAEEAAIGCDGDALLATPNDTSLDGPWPVGARTVEISGLTAEVWYPATPGSQAGKDPVRYDLREWLPDAEAAKISDAKAPFEPCNCTRDLPLDADHGPYPVVVFVHGTAGYRAQSVDIVTHWASRGFVVIAADHPGLYLADLITSLPMCPGEAPPQDLDGDLAKIVAAAQAPAGDLAFLDGHIDATRLAMTGHSAGGAAVEDQGGVAKVVIPMAAGGVAPGAALESALILGAEDDQVVAFSEQQTGFDTTTAPKTRLVGIGPAGHLVFSSLCGLHNADGEDIVTIGTDADVCGLSLAGALFDCDPTYITEPRGFVIIGDASSAALEETLQCAPARGERLSSLQTRYPEVLDYAEK